MEEEDIDRCSSPCKSFSQVFTPLCVSVSFQYFEKRKFCVFEVHLYLLCQQKNHVLIEAAENAAVIKGLPMLSLTSLDYFYLLKMDK